jgi:arsenate reductase
MAVQIWHNPRCSKSRQTLKILEEAGVEVETRRYLDNPPSTAELDRVLRMLNMQPIELVRMKEGVAKEMGLKGKDLTRAEWLDIMVEHPILIERPIVITEDGRAALGRPPEIVKGLLAAPTRR